MAIQIQLWHPGSNGGCGRTPVPPLDFSNNGIDAAHESTAGGVTGLGGMDCLTRPYYVLHHCC